MTRITHFYLYSVLQSISRELQNALGEANQVATETFSHIKTVKSFANEDGETEKYRCRLDDIYRLNKMESGAYAFSMWSSTVSAQTFCTKNKNADSDNNYKHVIKVIFILQPDYC